MYNGVRAILSFHISTILYYIKPAAIISTCIFHSGNERASMFWYTLISFYRVTHSSWPPFCLMPVFVFITQRLCIPSGESGLGHEEHSRKRNGNLAYQLYYPMFIFPMCCILLARGLIDRVSC